MALTQISTGGVKDDAVTAGKIPANAVGSSEIAKPIDLADNEKVRLGTGNDLEIYHNGSHSFIHDGGTGDLRITGSTIKFLDSTQSENLLEATENGAIKLYYDNAKKFETTSAGVKVTGGLEATGFLAVADNQKIYVGNSNDLQIFHDPSTGNWIKSYTSNTLKIETNGNTEITTNNTDTCAKFIKNGAVELYYDNSKKFETTSTGVTVTGTVSDSKGNLRSIPANSQSSAHVATAADAGKAIYISTGGVTLNNSVFAAGDAVTIINNSGSDQTITQGSGLTIHNSADAATGNRTLAGRGMATLWFADASTAYISGAGLS